MSGVEKSWGKTGERDREVKKESQLCKAILKSMEFTLGGMGEQGLKTVSRTEHRLDLTQVLKGLYQLAVMRSFCREAKVGIIQLCSSGERGW